jgi:hypothetical protein
MAHSKWLIAISFYLHRLHLFDCDGQPKLDTLERRMTFFATLDAEVIHLTTALTNLLCGYRFIPGRNATLFPNSIREEFISEAARQIFVYL